MAGDPMTALVIIAAAFVLIACGLTAKRYAEQILEEMHAVELRQIQRDRARVLDANIQARWRG